jgi:L-malate glycosyltransferase
MTITSPMCTGTGAYVVHRILERHIPKYKVLGHNPYWTLFPPLLPLFADRRASVVHTVPDYAIFFIPPRAKLVVTFHNYVLDPAMRPYSSFLQQLHYRTDLRLFIRLALRRARVVTAVSQATAELVRQDLDYTRPISVIPNGIDTRTFHPPKKRQEQLKLRVFFCGNPTRRKGAHWLPPIAERTEAEAEIWVTGGLRFGKMAAQHPRLRPLGPVSHETMPELYRSVDVLLMPTVREGMSLAVLEAMASGLPVVASDCSSLPELVHHGKGGFLCPLGDVNAFAHALDTLAGDVELRFAMGEYNRAVVEGKFSQAQMVAAYEAVFASLSD